MKSGDAHTQGEVEERDIPEGDAPKVRRLTRFDIYKKMYEKPGSKNLKSPSKSLYKSYPGEGSRETTHTVPQRQATSQSMKDSTRSNRKIQTKRAH